MLEIAFTLGKDFDSVRVDLYNLKGKIIVGELTFTHGGGTETFNPEQWDTAWGNLWNLE